MSATSDAGLTPGLSDAGLAAGASSVSGRWLVTGSGGMLGQDVMARLGSAIKGSAVESRAVESWATGRWATESSAAVGLNRAALDICDPAAVDAAFARYRPTVVINCAAWTAVDDAETSEPAALRINGEGPANLAAACARSGVRLLQVSTDYVFPGDAEKPYAEDDPTGPRTAYGRTKLAGEQAVLATLPHTGYVVRTAWLYGAGGNNFVHTMIKLESTKETLDVVDDQRGQPTWTVDLADRLVRLGASSTAPPGIYHGTSSGEGTWCDLARETFRQIGADPARIHPTTSAAYVRPAPRPAYSVLSHHRWPEAAIPPLPPWRDSLATYLNTR